MSRSSVPAAVLWPFILAAASCGPMSRPAAPSAGVVSPASLRPVPVVQNGHAGPISCLVYDPSGRILATGALDNVIKLWDAGSGRLLADLIGHTESVKALGFGPDGRLLASAGGDGAARLWDVPGGTCRSVLEGAGATMALSPDGSRLATGREDGRVWIWDTAKAERLLELGDVSGAPIAALAFTPDGRFVAAGGHDRSARLWDARTGRLLSVLSGHGSWITSLAVSPDGKTLATAGHDRTVMLWEIATGRRQATLSGHLGSIVCLAFSPSGRYVATGSRDGSARIWDRSTASLKVSLGRPHPPAEDLFDSVTALAFSPDERACVVSGEDGVVASWSVPEGRLRSRLAEPGGFVAALAFSPDGRTLAAGGLDNAVKLWDARSGKAKGSFRAAQSRGLLSLAFSPDGSRLAAGGHDGAAKVWDLAAGGLLSASPGRPASVRMVAFPPNGRTLLAASHDGSAILLDAATGRTRFAVPGDGAKIAQAAFSPDGRIIAAALESGAVRLLDSETSQPKTLLQGPGGTLTSLSFSPDGSLLAAGSDDDRARVWDIGTGILLRTLPGGSGGMRTVAFSPDGRWLATGGFDNTVRIWEPRTGRLRTVLQAESKIVWSSGRHDFVFSPEGGTLAAGGVLWDRRTGRKIAQFGEPSCAAFSRDGRTLFTGGDDGTISRREAATGRLVGSVPAHSAVVRALAISPDGRRLASAGEDTMIKLWDAATGDLLATILDFQAGRDWLAVTPEGFFDGTTGGWQRILWRWREDIAATAEPEQYFQEFYQPGLLKDIWKSGKPLPELLRTRGDPRAASTIADRDRRLPVVSLEAPAESSSRLVRVRLTLREAPPDRGHATGSGIRDVRLFRDGTLVAQWEGLRRSGSRLTCDVPIVEGRNTFLAYAFNRDNVKSRDVQLAVKGAASLRRPARAFILGLGIDRYSLERLKLDFAVKDVEDLASRLRESLPVPRELIVTRFLRDEQATRKGILAALRGLARDAGPEDSVLIVYSGHGATHDRTYYILPHDLGRRRGASLARLCARGISDRDLRAILAGRDGRGGLQAGHIALIIDACQSGQVLEADEWRVGPMNARSLVQLAWEKGMEILTASQSDQFAMELEGLGHGLLTYALLEGFREAPREDGRLGGSAWFDFAAAEVPKLPDSPKTRGLIPPFVKDAGAGRSSAPSRRIDVQTPKVFHRRAELDPKSWIVADSSRIEAP